MSWWPKRRAESYGSRRGQYGSGYMLNVPGRPYRSGMYRATARGGTRRRSGFTRTAGNYGRSLSTNIRSGRIANVQFKNWDNAVAFTTTVNMVFPSGGSIAALTASGAVAVGIANNTSSITRIGARIACKALEIQGVMTFSGGAFSADTLHFYVIVDKQTNGAVPVATDMWTTTVTGTQLRNLDNTNRFRVLKHYVMNFLGTYEGTAATYSTQTKDFRKHIPLKGILIDYNSTAGNISEIKSNNIYLAYGSHNGNVTFSGITRLRYTDN